VGGWLADRYGVRPVMTVGVLLLVGALYGFSTIDSLAGVYLMRALMGGALAGAGLVICVTIVSRWFVAKRGLALGLMLSGTSLGNAVIPQMNAALFAEHGWREAFTIICLIPLLLLRARCAGAHSPLPPLPDCTDEGGRGRRRARRLGVCENCREERRCQLLAARPALLRLQLRALIWAARGRPLRIMFPLVAVAVRLAGGSSSM
jgi:MFS family permease